MSSARITSGWVVALIFVGVAMDVSAAQTPSAAGGDVRQGAPPVSPAEAKSANPAQLLQHGQSALAQGQLEQAERDFRAVLAVDPQSGAAYSNLGVVYIRQKKWAKALGSLQKAEQLMPQAAGIRLNIGLAYYHQNEFLKAIGPFETVVRDQPSEPQPRYLLGQCYFFAERWADATTTLEPLWDRESSHLPYLYVLSNAARRAGRKDLDDRATAQLIKIGAGSPEYHLFAGKSHLNQGRYDQALAEFRAAAQANPQLPFVHFNLGLTYVKKQDYPRARDEFLQDAGIDPDLALNYDQLGDVYLMMLDNDTAENNYRHALQLDRRLVSSRMGLAKIYQQKEMHERALAELDAAEKLEPSRSDVRYLRARLLLRLGRKEEAKQEAASARQIDSQHQAESDKPAEPETLPSPELLQDPQ